MKNMLRKMRPRLAGFTIPEAMVGLGVMTVLMAAVFTGGTALTSTMVSSENYSVTQLQAMDYLSLDMRRAVDFTFTTSGGTLTLPLTLKLQQYYASNGKTPVKPSRTVVTTGNKKNKKEHKLLSAVYYYYYGTLGGTVSVTYSLSNGRLFRKEGTLSDREVARNISSVTFTPTLAEIKANPVVTTRIDFLASQRAKQAPPPLTSATFMREYYYSDY